MEENNYKNNKNLSVTSAIVVSGLLISGAIIFNSFNKNGGIIEKNNTVNIPEVTEEDFILGGKNYEITMVEYSDFSCSFCARYHPVMKDIVKNYSGKVRWVYRHLPIFNKQAAISSTCVGILMGDESFFNYADNLFIRQKDLNQEILREEAVKIGVLEEDYDRCVIDPNISNKISKDFSMTRILAGFNSTPTTVLIDKNRKMYTFTGALSYEEISSLVDSFLE